MALAQTNDKRVNDCLSIRPPSDNMRRRFCDTTSICPMSTTKVVVLLMAVASVALRRQHAELDNPRCDSLPKWEAMMVDIRSPPTTMVTEGTTLNVVVTTKEEATSMAKTQPSPNSEASVDGR
jgi:hypothetical protein